MRHARCDIETNDAKETSNDGELAVICLEVGNYFSIVANNDKENNFKFWVVICVEGLHMVTKDKHVYAFGQTFLYGNQVVISRYFNQQGRSPYSYVQCDQSEVYIFSHLVKVAKF